tara:strand:- start:184 stop:3600 length:3417 start_codon:yes stop_codon:yes gene_type:complete
MAAINQRIPNFLGGVSQQPDKIKFPGQVRVCDNAVPDVTFGLKKRPATEYLGTLTNANTRGIWHEILRDNEEKYLIQITGYDHWQANRTYIVGTFVTSDNGKVYEQLANSSGTTGGSAPTGTGSNIVDNTARWKYRADLSKWIRIWKIPTGLHYYGEFPELTANSVEMTLTNNAGDSLFTYLAGRTQVPGSYPITEALSPCPDYSVTTIQDYTLIANPLKTVTKSSGNTDTAIHNGDYAFARLDTIAYNTEYILYTPTGVGNNTQNPPTPNTYYRVTSVKVDKLTTQSDGSLAGDGPTFDDTNEDQSLAGTLTWSFSGGDQILGTSNNSNCSNIEGALQINGTSFIKSNTANYDGTGTESSDFLGYTQDYDVRYTATVTLSDGGLIRETNINTAKGKFIDVRVEGITYRVSVEAVEPVTTYQDVAGIGFFKSPKNPDNGTLSMGAILSGLATSVNSNLTNVTAEVVGSGIFLYGSAASNVNFLGGAVNENMSVIGQRAQDISRLPAMCIQGYVAQISNTADSDADDYYVKFEADNGISGVGSWEETVRPHNFAGTGSDEEMKMGFTISTMPHALINNRNGTFTFAQLNETTAISQGNDNFWKNRAVGDNNSNPFPTFTGKAIQKLFFHRNRLGIIADEQVVLSQPGQYFNMFIVSAIAASDDNPIDITVSDVKPAFIRRVLPVQKGIMMFSDNAQFLLFSDADIFSPKTARLKKMSSYEGDGGKPVDLGTSVLFTSNVGEYLRAFEVTVLDANTPPQVTEQTRVVPEFIPNAIDVVANSVALGVVSYASYDFDTDITTIYHYKYYDVGQKREQSAWYTWTIQGRVYHMAYTIGNLYIALRHENTFKLLKSEYRTDISEFAFEKQINDGFIQMPSGSTISQVGSLVTRKFEPHLDVMVFVDAAVSVTNNNGVYTTVFPIPYVPQYLLDDFGNPQIYVVGLAGIDGNGNNVAGMVRQADAIGSTQLAHRLDNSTQLTYGTVTLNDFRAAGFGWPAVGEGLYAIGYKFTTTVELPTYFLNTGQNTYDTNGSLRISGFNFELGEGGPIEFNVTSTEEYVDTSTNPPTVTPSIDPYVQRESGVLANRSTTNTMPISLSSSVRVPIQQKNDKFRLQIKIPDPFPTAIISGSWDGNYSNKRHVRR